MPTKSIFSSRTVGINLLVAIGVAFPKVGVFIQEHPQSVLYGFIALNLFLRKISHGKITLSPESDS